MKRALIIISNLICLVLYSNAIDIRATENSFCSDNLEPIAGDITFVVSQDEFPTASIEEPNYIQIQLNNGTLSETLVDWHC